MTTRQADFPPEPESARAVRAFVSEALPELPQREDVVLAASELAANVIRHARTEFTVRLVTQPECTRLEVSDGSAILPAVEELSDSYRGLRMIESISERWGADPTESGKTVWVEFAPVREDTTSEDATSR